MRFIGGTALTGTRPPTGQSRLHLSGVVDDDGLVPAVGGRPLLRGARRADQRLRLGRLQRGAEVGERQRLHGACAVQTHKQHAVRGRTCNNPSLFLAQHSMLHELLQPVVPAQ